MKLPVSMIERIRLLMQSKSLSSTQFADEVEVPRAVISHLLSGRNKPSLDVMLKIVQAFPEISMNWLMLGEGEMLTKLAKQQRLPTAPPVPAKVVADTVINAEEEKAHAADASKLQEKHAAVPPVLPAAAQQKAIEQVIIFYTDKTFSMYTLG